MGATEADDGAAPEPPQVPGILVIMQADGEHATLRVIGELDVATASELDRAVDRCLREGNLEVVLDLAELAFVDAAGLRVLVRARRALEAAGGTLYLVNLSPFVRRVLSLTGLTGYLGADPGCADASRPEGRP